MKESREEIIKRLRNEGDDLLSQLRHTNEAQVGDSVPMVFNTQFAREHGIYEIGRMSLKNGTRLYHACPLNFRRESTFDMETPQYTAQIENRSKNIAEYTDPGAYHYAKLKHERDFFHQAEVALFKQVKPFGKLLLINPSKGSLYRAMESCGSNYEFGVYCTNGFDSSETYEILQKGHREEDWYETYPKDWDGISYLGSNGATYEKVSRYRKGNWFSMVASPFAAVFPFSEYRFSRRAGRLDLSYFRKGREVKTSIEHGSHNVYSSTDVCAGLSIAHYNPFFLETNILHFNATSQAGVDIVGYLPHLPPYVNGVSKDANYVYDVKTKIQTTWVNRWDYIDQVAVQLGLEVCPLQESGAYEVTWNGLEPHGTSVAYSQVIKDGVLLSQLNIVRCSYDEASGSSFEPQQVYVVGRDVLGDVHPSCPFLFYRVALVSPMADPRKRKTVLPKRTWVVDPVIDTNGMSEGLPDNPVAEESVYGKISYTLKLKPTDKGEIFVTRGIHDAYLMYLERTWQKGEWVGTHRRVIRDNPPSTIDHNKLVREVSQVTSDLSFLGTSVTKIGVKFGIPVDATIQELIATTDCWVRYNKKEWYVRLVSTISTVLPTSEGTFPISQIIAKFKSYEAQKVVIGHHYVLINIMESISIPYVSDFRDGMWEFKRIYKDMGACKQR